MTTFALHYFVCSIVRRRVLAAALCAAVVTLAMPVVAQEKKPDEQPPTPVGVDHVRQETMRQTVPVIGRFVPRQAGLVAARIAGPVKTFLVEVGDRVAAGDLLAALVKDTFRWRVSANKAETARYNAEIRTKKARVKLLMQEARRLDNLKKSPAFSQARLEDKRQEVVVAESEVAEASGQLAKARADLSLAKLELDYTEIRAPYAGVVTKRHTEVGAFVRVGDPIVSLVDDTRLEIEADVPSGRVAGLEPGKAIDVAIVGGVKAAAIVRAVVPEENPQTRTRVVRFVLSDAGDMANLAANQSVTLAVPAAAAAHVLTVHKDAVITRGGGTLVYLVIDGKAMIRFVQLGEAVGTRFVVRHGLKVGDIVVVRGNERLRPGQPVSIPPAASMRGTQQG